MLWKEIKNNYKNWPKNGSGYNVSPDNFWISIGDSVKVGDYACIGDSARIGDNASIGNNACIDYSVKVGNNACIGDYACIDYSVKVGNNASIGDYACIEYSVKIGDNASIGNSASIGRTLTYLIGSRHQVYLYDPDKKMIGIGCIIKTIQHWQEKYKEIGQRENYSDQQITEYKKYIDLFADSLNIC